MAFTSLSARVSDGDGGLRPIGSKDVDIRQAVILFIAEANRASIRRVHRQCTEGFRSILSAFSVRSAERVDVRLHVQVISQDGSRFGVNARTSRQRQPY